MRALLAVAVLLCAPSVSNATLVTYELTGRLAFAYGDSDRPVDYARGYITFDTNAWLMSSKALDGTPDGYFGSRTNIYGDLFHSLAISYGDDFTYAAGPGSTAIFGADWMGTNGETKHVEWWLSARMTTIDDRFFSILMDRRCNYDDCPEPSLPSLLSYDDWLEIPGFSGPGPLFTFSVRDSLEPGPGEFVIYDVTSFKKVPEPGTLVLFGLALIGVALSSCYRSRHERELLTHI